ncbi:MAG: hypothetical protein HQ541_00660 [Mariniphaga sp.]|nr:hypothetical protein [Mariniphaga sp.]
MILNKTFWKRIFISKPIISVCILLILIIAYKSKPEPELIKETWIGKSISEWPDFALTNEISFNDITYRHLANSF